MNIQVQRNSHLLISPPSLMVLSVSHLGAYAFYQKMHALHLHLVSGSQPPSLETSVTSETLGRILHLNIHKNIEKKGNVLKVNSCILGKKDSS